MIYELIKTNDYSVVKRTDRNNNVSWIPLDLENSDYQQYLAFTEWITAGKEPDDFWNQGDK